MINIKNITKTYGNGKRQIEVLKGINLSIQEGDFIVITGASGSGKSTLMNVISGLERPDRGEIWYGDIDITTLNDKMLTNFRKDNVGFVFQQYFLLPNMNVEKNVKMGADLAGNKHYKAILETVGLQDKRKAYPSELSGGEQQRVSIARALAKKPKVLFLDEPTGALDEETGRSILNYIDKLHETSGFTIVMVTHNMNIAEMADTVIKMNSGNIVDTYTNSVHKHAYEIGW